MVNSISTKLGAFAFLFFILSTIYSSLYFVKGFLKIKEYLSTRSTYRYEPLEKYFKGDTKMEQYISKNKNRTYMYQQVVWYILDGLPIYILEPRPNTSKN